MLKIVSNVEFCVPVHLARSELMPHFIEGSFENPCGVRPPIIKVIAGGQARKQRWRKARDMLIGRQTTLIHRVKGDQLDLGMTHGFSLDGKVMQVRPLTVTSASVIL